LSYFLVWNKIWLFYIIFIGRESLEKLINKGECETLVLIVHWNSPRECLNTVEQFEKTNLSLKIKILDNGSLPENISFLQKFLRKSVDLVLFSENLGWVRH
jgi:hypothetical protein